MIVGKALGRGVATNNAGLQVPFRIVEPAKTPENVKALAQQAERWKQLSLRFEAMRVKGLLPVDVAKRARFGDEVMAVIASNVSLGVCCELVTEAADGRVLAAMVYNYGAMSEAFINLLVIDPEQLAGSPGTAQLRGMGTSMVAAVSREFLAKGVQEVYLHPLDAQAGEFWGKRGFGVCGRGSLCVRGRDKVQALIGLCETGCCDDEVCVVCGRVQDTEAVRLPALRKVI